MNLVMAQDKIKPDASVTSEVTESVVCAVCGADDFNVLQAAKYPPQLTATDFLKMYHSSSDQILLDQVVQCRQCDLVYLNPRIRSDIILQAYSDAVDSTFIAQNPLRVRTFYRTLEKLKNELGLKEKQKVLDIGCAGGAFLKAASDLGFKTTGVEPSRWLCEFGKKEYGLDLRPGVLADHKFEVDSFDLITMWDVIEHLTDPKKELSRIREILKPDALLVLNYPDVESWACRILGKKWPFYLGVHLIYFSPQTITRLLKESGYEVLSIRPFWQTLELGYVFQRASAYFSAFNWLKRLVSFLKMDKLPFTYNVGQTTVIARKRPQSINTVIFDMDGVLFHSNQAHANAYIETLKAEGITDFEYSQYAGLRTDEVFERVFEKQKRSLTPDKLQQLVARKRELARESLKAATVAQDASQALKHLREKYKLALASSSSSQNVNMFLDKSGSSALFSAVVNGEQVKKAKPAPDIFLEALRCLGSAAANTVVIEDSLNGLEAAQKAGCSVIAITGTHTRKTLEDKGFKTIDHLSELTHLL